MQRWGSFRMKKKNKPLINIVREKVRKHLSAAKGVSGQTTCLIVVALSSCPNVTLLHPIQPFASYISLEKHFGFPLGASILAGRQIWILLEFLRLSCACSQFGITHCQYWHLITSLICYLQSWKWETMSCVYSLLRTTTYLGVAKISLCHIYITEVQLLIINFLVSVGWAICKLVGRIIHTS